MKSPLTILNYHGEPLSAVLSRLPLEARDVILCGPLPGVSVGDLVPWVNHSDVMGDWEDAGTYLGQEEDRAPTVALKRGAQSVRIRWSSAWTDAEVDAQALALCFAALDDSLSSCFRNRSLNFASPVALGRHLMTSAWKREGREAPAPPPREVQEVLRDHSPQGRHELLTLPRLETIPALYQYDMRLAYLWCCKGLPYGEIEPDPEGGQKRIVSWFAPDNWDHLGLLPERRQGWTYPREGHGLADEREIGQAERNGWTVAGATGWRWGREGALDGWADGIQAALRQVGEGTAYRMLRRVALNTIGSLHRSSVKRYRSVPVERKAEVPPGCPNLRLSEDGKLLFWSEEQPISPRSQCYVQPQITTTIWARCRARVALAALQFPREQIIAIRQDALFVTHPHPTWKEAPGIGRFRLKQSLRGPLPAPHSLEELRQLRLLGGGMDADGVSIED